MDTSETQGLARLSSTVSLKSFNESVDAMLNLNPAEGTCNPGQDFTFHEGIISSP
jgi:hypothetical protein